METIMSSGSKDVLAVQTLRNSVMAASFMASTAVLLIMGTLTVGSDVDKISKAWHALNLQRAGTQRHTHDQRHVPARRLLRRLLLLLDGDPLLQPCRLPDQSSRGATRRRLRARQGRGLPQPRRPLLFAGNAHLLLLPAAGVLVLRTLHDGGRNHRPHRRPVPPRSRTFELERGSQSFRAATRAAPIGRENIIARCPTPANGRLSAPSSRLESWGMTKLSCAL
ncbi:MAG: DUF599 domain-containing protein [Comamonadaceae bacterium]|nr:DUF599 domain-containing protein [Comamonadaceae bacterium]